MREGRQKKGVCSNIMTKQLVCLSKLRFLCPSLNSYAFCCWDCTETYPPESADFVGWSDAVRGGDHSWSHNTNSDICFSFGRQKQECLCHTCDFISRFCFTALFYDVCSVGRETKARRENVLPFDLIGAWITQSRPLVMYIILISQYLISNS